MESTPRTFYLSKRLDGLDRHGRRIRSIIHRRLGTLGFEQKETNMNESSFKTANGLNIFMRSWKAEGNPRAVICLVHGFNAHSGYMIWPAEKFAAHGLVAYALDL